MGSLSCGWMIDGIRIRFPAPFVSREMRVTMIDRVDKILGGYFGFVIISAC
jgi:hypothetical protein